MMTITPGIGATLPPPYILGLPKGDNPTPAPNEARVTTPSGGKAFGPELGPIPTNRPGGAPLHSGGIQSILPNSPGNASIALTLRPVDTPLPTLTQNPILENTQANHTEMVGLLLDRFA